MEEFKKKMKTENLGPSKLLADAAPDDAGNQNEDKANMPFAELSVKDVENL